MEAPYVVGLNDGVWIDGRYYCKNLGGLQAVLTNLRTVGYVVENKRHTDRRQDVEVGEFEATYRPMWTGELPGVNMLQCGSCLGIIGYPWSYREDTEDSHGRPCEFCGVPTMVASGENYKGPDPFIPNCSEVLFWRGQVFPKPPPDYGIPYPISVDVYEAWRWAPLAKGESLAHQVLAIGRMSSRRDWFREGEQLNDAQKRIADMATFVGNFTTVNRGEWNTVMGEIARNHPAPALDVYDAVTRLCI